MGIEAEAALADAEHSVSAGLFDQAAERLAILAPMLSDIDRPDLLARASWVAAMCALAGSEARDFEEMSSVAAHALELAEGRAARRELEALARRVSAISTIAGSGDPEAGVIAVLAEHVRLLRRLARDDEDEDAWILVDADRASWPELFAALRASLGRPCAAERATSLAAGDPVAAVVIAVAPGLGDHPLPADELAALCFRDGAAAAEARRQIDELLARGVLSTIDGAVVLST